MQERIHRGVLLGLVILSFLAPLKFTHPVILYRLVYWPHGVSDWIFSEWPNVLFYIVLILLTVVGLGIRGWRTIDRRILLLPSVFLVIQGLSTLRSVDESLSKTVFALFLSLGAGFLLGAKTLKNLRDIKWIVTSWFTASIFVAWSGVHQATGGLQELYQFLHAHPGLASHQPALWKKIEGGRIFATFVYPNALGGFVISAIFVVVAWCFISTQKMNDDTMAAAKIYGRLQLQSEQYLRAIAALLLVIALFFCLWKSQSKGAYLSFFITLILGSFIFIRRRPLALGFVAVVLFIAVIGFGLGYGHAALEKGNQTWRARMDYWKAAYKIGLDYPLLGSGPGTFSTMYLRYKSPGSEITRLVHNNYLQMWSDSGFLGFLTFMIWLPGSLILWARCWRHVALKQRVVPSLLWCACTAFAIHSFVDFDLYMISNAWPIFVLLGYLINTRPVEMKTFVN